ncbi:MULTISPECIES: DUF2946 family protein [unclassified Variovorax]|jgi:hypothetical protein|uniref:DUF2946 family protein n=1 Tax=unclassified Variovorax TaxID=663243 RepID=UPI000F7DF014|nr:MULTISPECIES: DUF2946 family protein [unclassified Variovorax]RSZ41205.1 DUF2946 domain-containing protein [Variovorax sp. 553]RSZ41887.1 DUF2946 domain-containing protein [Variovorax sp. 679]
MPAPSHATPNRPAGLRRPGVSLIRWVLLWFALSLGVAVASPVVHPQTVELVCSNAGSVKAIVHTDDGAQELGAGHMDCPLCVLNAAPPATTPAVELPVLVPLARAVQSIPSTRITVATAAPLPARGPPPLI